MGYNVFSRFLAVTLYNGPFMDLLLALDSSLNSYRCFIS